MKRQSLWGRLAKLEQQARIGREPFKPWIMVETEDGAIYTTREGQSYTEPGLSELEQQYRLVVVELA
jgi:hypothetical protein